VARDAGRLFDRKNGFRPQRSASQKALANRRLMFAGEPTHRGLTADEANGSREGRIGEGAHVHRIDGYGNAHYESMGDEVEIDSIDLSFGMGGTFVDYEPGSIEIAKAKFSREWLRKFTHSSPELLFTTSGVGDSMAPTINDQDVVIVDRSEQRLDGTMGEKIWAIVFGGVGMIKRLRPLPDGTVKIMSDNQLVRDELATDNDLFIVGRVVGSVRRH
jgi:hypothetical protein